MATWEDVRRLALALSSTSEGVRHGNTTWFVADKGFVWERPLRKNEIAALGPTAPEPPILGAHVDHLGIKEALLAQDPEVFFTTPHFDGYPAVLIRLERISVDQLREVIEDAWLAKAPKKLARAHIART